MRYIYLLLLMLPLRGMAQQPTVRMDSILKDTFNIPFLQDIVEYYFYYYFDFPENSTELIRFSKKIAKEASLQYYNAEKVIWEITIPKLDYYRENFVIHKDDDAREYDIKLFARLLAKSTENYNSVPYPCDIKKYSRGTCEDYKFFLSRLGGPVFFNQENEPIIYPGYSSYRSDFDAKMRKYRKKYIAKELYRYHNSCRIPLQTFYEYKAGDGLYFYCTQERVTMDCVYFEKLEKYLAVLCKEKGITKIIFLSLEL